MFKNKLGKQIIAFLLMLCMVVPTNAQASVQSVIVDENMVTDEEDTMIQPSADDASTADVASTADDVSTADDASAGDDVDAADVANTADDTSTADDTAPADDAAPEDDAGAVDNADLAAVPGMDETSGETGENLYENEIITGMDENGNIYEFSKEEVDAGRANPGEAGIATMTLEPMLVNFHTKSSSVTTSYQEYGTGKGGYLNGAYGGDALYLGTENGKVKFMMSGVTGLVAADAVTLVPWSDAKSYSHYEVNSSGQLIHYITTNISGTSYASRLYNGPAPSYLKTGVKYLSYDGHYFYTENQYEVMQEDCNAGHRNHALNSSSPFYNYYQFLSFRTKTNYTKTEMKNVLNNHSSIKGTNSKLLDLGDVFVTYQSSYGINALLAVGIACNESAYGKSNICQTKNNLFGINAVDSSPGESANTFATPAACVKDYMETYLSKRYCRPNYTHYNGAFLGNKASGANVKYASDPYWGEKAAAIVWKLDDANGGKDKQKYTIGVKNPISTDHTQVNIRNKATTDATSTVLYDTTRSGHAFTILNNTPTNGFYKLASEGVLNSNNTAIDSSTGNYDYATMYLYGSTKHIQIVSAGNNNEDKVGTYSLSYRTYVTNLGWRSTVKEGTSSGKTGEGYAIEAFKVTLTGSADLGIKYQAYMKGTGWQSTVTSGKTAGSITKKTPIEAIKLELTGDDADLYDIYYRTYIRGTGWLDWAKNGEAAGCVDMEHKLQAISIKIVKKGAAAPGATTTPYQERNAYVKYRSYINNVGWGNTVKEGVASGKTGTGYTIGAFKVTMTGTADLDLEYSIYAKGSGWQTAVESGGTAGSTTAKTPVEGIRIALTGADADKYDIYYRTYIRGIGWMDWAKNGEAAGCAGYETELQAIMIKMVVKGAAAPGSTTKPFKEKNSFITYQTYVNKDGWRGTVKEGKSSGKTGVGYQIEALKITLNTTENVGIKYRVYTEGSGWQTAVTSGKTAGSTTKKKAVEGVKIELTGTDASKYDIYYRTYIRGIGWMGWAKNGESAGYAGFDNELQAVTIQIVEKGSKAPGSTTDPFKEKKSKIEYQTYISSDIGWRSKVSEGTSSGKTGHGYTIDAMKISITGSEKLGLKTSVYLKNIGWQDSVESGAVAGSSGQNVPIEGMKLELTGTNQSKYDLYYQMYVRGVGWLGWAKNGEAAGCIGYGYCIQAIRIKMVEKDGKSPGTTSGAYMDEKYMWPLPSSSRITSYFGYRPQPTAGASSYHQGIDIGAPTGSVIVAAKSGTVTASTSNSIRGNYVEITHDDGIKTVYMHMHARAVSVGETVIRGETIGYVGSTGVATGPHLHFSVVQNGTNVNPLYFVSP